MEFDEKLGQFKFENNGLIFAWDKEPDEEISGVVEMLTENYYLHLDDAFEKLQYFSIDG
ncbi:MAG: hypothetical protein II838_09595 [Lachnospiraceae bacterium]|nr:hypothetical protein [Lachnospiraceae bacterium]